MSRSQVQGEKKKKKKKQKERRRRRKKRSHVQRQKPFRERRSTFLIWICLAQPIPTLLRSVIKCPRPQKGPLPGGRGSPMSSLGVSFALQGAQEPQKCLVIWPSWACLPTLHLCQRQRYGCLLSSFYAASDTPTPPPPGSLSPVPFLAL